MSKKTNPRPFGLDLNLAQNDEPNLSLQIYRNESIYSQECKARKRLGYNTNAKTNAKIISPVLPEKDGNLAQRSLP